MVSDSLKNIVELVLSQNVSVIGKVVLSMKWDFTGGSTGPGIDYFDKEMVLLPNSGMRGFPVEIHRRIGEIFRDEFNLETRQNTLDGYLANRCELTIYPDHCHELKWWYDHELDDLMLQDIKSYLTQKELDDAVEELADYKRHKGRSKKWRQRYGGEPAEHVEDKTAKPMVAETESAREVEKLWSTMDLLGTIVSTAIDAAPKGWEMLAIDGEVKTIIDENVEILNDISIDFQARMDDGTLKTIVPNAPIASMNALNLLQKHMPLDDGTVWKRIRILYTDKMKGRVVLEYDQPGRWTGSH